MRISLSSLVRSLASALPLALALAACAGGSPDPVVRHCTKSLYEFCVTEHDCESQNCVKFTVEDYQICTQGCDASTPCPDLNGTPATCSMNVCKPQEPVECEVVP